MKLILDNGTELNVTLSDEEVKKLCKKDNALWFPKDGENAWYIDGLGSISSATILSKKHLSSMYLHKLGHIFKTKEKAEKHLALIEAKYLVRKRIAELNNGWKPDWTNNSIRKYCFSSRTVTIEIDIYFSLKYQPTWMYLKSREQAEQLIEELEPELRLVLEE